MTPSKEPASPPQGTPPAPKEEGMQKVDQDTQEKAAEEREESGGYD